MAMDQRSTSQKSFKKLGIAKILFQRNKISVAIGKFEIEALKPIRNYSRLNVLLMDHYYWILEIIPSVLIEKYPCMPECKVLWIDHIHPLITPCYATPAISWVQYLLAWEKSWRTLVPLYFSLTWIKCYEGILNNWGPTQGNEQLMEKTVNLSTDITSSTVISQSACSEV